MRQVWYYPQCNEWLSLYSSNGAKSSDNPFKNVGRGFVRFEHWSQSTILVVEPDQEAVNSCYAMT